MPRTDFRKLIRSGQALKVMGNVLLIRYTDGRTVKLSHVDEKAARDTVRTFLLEVQKAHTNADYDRKIDEYLHAVKNAWPTHTHECADQKSCQFDWSQHTEAEDCVCNPHRIETGQRVQFVHQPLKKQKGTRPDFNRKGDQDQET